MSQEEKDALRTVTLKEHQAERAAWWASNKPFKGDRAFIKCPKRGCTGQLLYKDHTPVVLSPNKPPEKRVHCSKCDYSTRVLA